MKYLIGCLVIVALAAGSALAADKLDEKTLAGMTVAIRSAGYVCKQANDGRFTGQGHRGLEFRVLCNDDALAYKVVVTQDNRFLVSPD